MTKPIGALSRNDLATLCISAVRYALGRRTYITGDTTRIISRLRPQLSQATVDVILRDIREADRTHGLGDVCDRRAWGELCAQLEGMLP